MGKPDYSCSQLARRFAPFLALCVVLVLFFLWALPLTTLPPPTGPYAVGTSSYAFVSAEKDPFSNKRSKNRELAFQLWYPTASTNAARATYMAPLADLNAYLRAPFFALLACHLSWIKTHAYVNVPVSPAQGLYPVLVFSHGLMGGRIQNTVQMEELASHGYVVAALDHSFDAAFSIFPDGHVITSQLLAGKDSAESATLTDFDVDERINDVYAVINRISLLNENDPHGLFTRRLDLKNLGVFGHSMGGETAIWLCQHSPIKAAISYDGVPDSASALKAPLMVLQADREGDPMQLAKLHSTGPGGAFYNVKLLRSGHANFTDLPFISPLHWVTGLSGSIDQTEAERTINAYTLSFFNKYLKATKDEPSALQFKSAKCVVMPN